MPPVVDAAIAMAAAVCSGGRPISRAAIAAQAIGPYTVDERSPAGEVWPA